MDDLLKIYNSKYGEKPCAVPELAADSPVDKIGDFIAAFLDVVTSEDVGRVKKTGIA
jgi:hypothetical protein